MIAEETFKVLEEKEKPPANKSVTVREATPFDVPGIIVLWQAFIIEMQIAEFGMEIDLMSAHATILDAIVNNDSTYTLVICDGDDIVGAAMVNLERQWLCTSQIMATEKFWFLLPQYRKGCSAGIRAVKMLEDWAKNEGASIISVGHFSTSPPSVGKVLTRRGFTPFFIQYLKEI